MGRTLLAVLLVVSLGLCVIGCAKEEPAAAPGGGETAAPAAPAGDVAPPAEAPKAPAAPAPAEK